MEEGYELDLTYVTERIIAVSFPRACSEDTYLHNLQDVTRMLRSKHGDSYLVINLSEKRYDLSKMNPKTMDTGWPDLHAPPLDKICTICKAMESWLNADPQHVVVIHCRGGKGRIGVIISSYVHFTNISASADQALDRFAMKKFYDDKVSALMTPSQKRYVWILNSLLTGSMKMNSSLLFLHYILLHGIPKLDASGVCRLYLKVYQGMQAVYTSGIYIDPPGREVVFRVQFHTGMVHGCRLTFDKEDLEHANSDSRFPHYGKIELVFSEIPEKMQGCDHWQNGPGVVVDYDIGDPLVRWDSYEKLSADGEVLHTQGPVDNSLYAKVRKKSADSAPTGTVTNSPEHSDHALSASSDSGLSSTSVRTGRGPSRQERAALQRLLSGFGLEAPALPKEMEEQRGPGPGAGGGHHVVPAQMHTNGEGERETDILDDEAPAHDLHSVDSIGTLSSSEGLHCQPLGRCGCHQSSQNSLLSDGFGGLAPATADLGFGSDDNERDRGPGYTTQVALTTPQAFGQGGYFTQTWVRQQQMVAAQQYVYPPADGEVQFQREKPGLASPKTSPVAPNTPIRGSSSREATLRAGGGGLGDPNVQETSLSKDDELASLTVDIDQSIDQLNQLIMDLDPTFVPIPTQTSLVRREGRGHVNGTASPCANGRGRRLTDGMEGTLPISYQTALGHLTPPYPGPLDLSGLSHSAPNCHSSPRGTPRGQSCRALGPEELTQDLEQSLLAAMEGLGRGGTPVQPSLPEKRRVSEGEGEHSLGTGSPALSGFSSPHSGSTISIPFPSVLPDLSNRGQSSTSPKHVTVKFVQDTSKFWYKPDISRDQAISVLKDKEPGSFIVRDSHSFRGAYGLAMKVATPPPSVLQQSKKADLSSELVRHFLIECTPKGVRLKGCPNEPYFGSLPALVCQHSITPLALPCKLIIPDRGGPNTSTELLKQGAACNVWYLGSVEMESLTGYQAVQKAASMTLSMDPPPTSTVVHFKVSAQGITLTDNQRKLFFRRHYAVSTVIFCALDPQDRKIFGFVARKTGSSTENVCHVFAEHDPEQPASAIVNFVSKVMIGSLKNK
uniref:Tensin 3 n=1 Tax=Scleropages formosus TaxID=113540 RepID=A0A8C9RR00_SCLFO